MSFPQQKKATPTVICKYGCQCKLIWDGTLRKFRDADSLELHDCREWIKDPNTGIKVKPYYDDAKVVSAPLLKFEGAGLPSQKPQDNFAEMELLKEIADSLKTVSAKLDLLAPVKENIELISKYTRFLGESAEHLRNIDEEVKKMNKETIEFEDGNLSAGGITGGVRDDL